MKHKAAFVILMAILTSSCANLDPVTVHLIDQRLEALEGSRKAPGCPEGKGNFVIIWIDMPNGSRLPVKIVQTGEDTFLGPKGEVYDCFPSTDSLERLYAPDQKRSSKH